MRGGARASRALNLSPDVASDQSIWGNNLVGPAVMSNVVVAVSVGPRPVSLERMYRASSL